MRIDGVGRFGVLLAALALACDPYGDGYDGPPAIVAVNATGGSPEEGAVRQVAGTLDAAGAWTIPAETSCAATPSGESTTARQFVVFVRTNTLLDGRTIEWAPNTCVPAGESPGAQEPWFRVTRDGVPETGHWYSCYYPSTASAEEGASVVFYRASAPRDWSTVDAAGAPAPTLPGRLDAGRGWFAIGRTLPVASDDVTVYDIQGTVKDRHGNDLPIHVVLEALPGAGSAGLAIADVTEAPAVSVAWTRGACATSTGATYALERRSGAAEWVPLATEGTAHLDGEVVYGDAYEYRLVEAITGAASGRTFESVRAVRAVTVLQIPSAPALTGVTASGVTASWEPVPGAVSYTLERAVEFGGAPARFIVVAGAEALGGTTFTDARLDPATGYYYRVVANGANGRSEPGQAARVTTLP